MKRKFLSMVLAVSLLIGMAMALPATAGEAESKPIIQNGGFEEVAEDGISPINWTGGTWVESGKMEGNLSHSGNGFLYIENSTYSAPFVLEAETEYILTLYSRTSIENSAQIDIRFRANGNTFDKSIPGQYVPGTHLFQENFGSAHSAPAEGETDGRFRWEKQEICFTTPALTDSAFFYIYNKGADEYLCIDDVSIAPSGDEPNLIPNGRLRAFSNDGKIPSGFAKRTSFTTQPTYSIDANGDTVAKMTVGGYYGSFGWYLKGGRYKLSFDYRNDGSASYVPQIYMKAGSGTWTDGYRSALQNTQDKGVWQRYEFYFTVTGDYVSLTDVRIAPGYTKETIPSYFKNIRLWKDEINVEYGSFFNASKSPLSYDANKGHSTEWYMPVDAISDVKAVEGVHTIQTKAHYIPTGTGDESFMLIDSVFKVYDDGREVLTDIAFKNGSTTGGIVGGANSSIAVPALTGEENYTYEIRSFIWSGINTMMPVIDKTVLTY